MGAHLDILEWVEAQPTPEDRSERTPKAWAKRYFDHVNEKPDKLTLRSLLSGVGRRLRENGSHHHLLVKEHIVPPRTSRGKQPTWGAGVEPARETTIIEYAQSPDLTTLADLVSKDGFGYVDTGPVISQSLRSFDGAPRSLQRVHVTSVMAMAKETALERVQRENAEQRAKEKDEIIEDLRNDKRAWQELAIARAGGRGTSVAKP